MLYELAFWIFDQLKYGLIVSETSLGLIISGVRFDDIINEKGELKSPNAVLLAIALTDQK